MPGKSKKGGGLKTKKSYKKMSKKKSYGKKWKKN
jgi:hypothetical protein